MKVTQLLRGMTIKTTRGPLTVQTCSPGPPNLQRLSFTNGNVILAPLDTDYVVLADRLPPDTNRGDTTKQAIDAWAVVLDDTPYNEIDTDDQPYVAAIHSVSLFDREITEEGDDGPNYWLTILYTRVILTKDGEALPDSEIEALREEYEECGGSALWVPCKEVDAVLDRCDSKTSDHFGHPVFVKAIDGDKLSYDDKMAIIEQHYHESGLI